ncbi:hypothetical protein COZ73_04160 [Candidatus Falkowbacteria bacterium CG_4_8_14_3_um_filter_36_11]|nr:MAG: hypothetical protein COZ73_04160 [Candidatus Falkowbacteria bacterium CG_4_8_14_3_um_filter_36_11]
MKESFLPQTNICYRINDFNPQKQTIVFVHGVSGSLSAWQEFEKRFKQKYNILMFDLRGHGRSFKPRTYESYRIELFAQDLRDLIDYFNINKCVLISHSYGNLITLAFLKNNQNRVDRAVLLSPQYAVKKIPLARIFMPLFRLAAKIKLPVPFSKIRGRVDYAKYKNTTDWNIRRNFADIRNTGLRVYLYCACQAHGFNGENILAKIKIPVLIIHGKKDTIFPLKYTQVMADKIPAAKMIVINNADHILVLNHFREIAPMIENFVEGLNQSIPRSSAPGYSLQGRV